MGSFKPRLILFHVARQAFLSAGVLHYQSRHEDGPKPENDDSFEFFSSSDSLEYTPFFADFGPVNLGKVSVFGAIGANAQACASRGHFGGNCSAIEDNLQ